MSLDMISFLNSYLSFKLLRPNKYKWMITYCFTFSKNSFLYFSIPHEKQTTFFIKHDIDKFEAKLNVCEWSILLLFMNLNNSAEIKCHKLCNVII
jgi:hypothetical protein